MARDDGEGDAPDELEKTSENSGFEDSNTKVGKAESKYFGAPRERPTARKCAKENRTKLKLQAKMVKIAEQLLQSALKCNEELARHNEIILFPHKVPEVCQVQGLLSIFISSVKRR